MDQTALLERNKYERMWTLPQYRDDHATAHARKALDLLKPGPDDSIIDFGSGSGYASACFKDHGLGVLAIDIAANAMLPDIASRVPVLIGTLWDIPVDLSSTWGFCADVMEHVPSDRVEDVLRFIRRSTRKAVYFHISVRPDGCGRLIGETLHLTVQPLEWWATELGKFWSDVRVVGHQPGNNATFIATI